ncbi:MULTISPECIES: carbohydrate ABC transporter permease [Bifidobacterium]|uniref:Sugar ABC transporter permease n=2 Tax=Bacillati TaxID=1783272 RepID=A0A556R5W7_9BIFI|nr:MULTISPECIES: sugar ABC transporter permease [Bifidobacterium]MBI0137057.1 sugar ABC transporter permease [Bifidobacterium sp. W8120]MCT6917930.1 sugar ABC transporter permease [Bifidobacteriales bacterium]TSJ84280.1 sugar ABC transporter permease [Bifidobacterium apousia]
MRRRKGPILMVFPGVVLLFCFMTVPALMGMFYSLTDYRGYGGWKFIGLSNYQNLVKDSSILHSYIFTLGFAFLAAILTNMISLLLAAALTQNIRLKGFLRGVFFLPAVLATIVIGYVFNFIFSQAITSIGKGLHNDFLSRSLLGNPQWAWVAIVIVAVWQACAVTTVIYMTGIESISSDIYEAAKVDGANRRQVFWRITLPLVMPFVAVNMVLQLKNQLQVFDLVVALTNGGPGTATQSISFLIYRNGFQGGQFAYQSANAVMYFVLILFISLVQMRLFRSREN